MSDVPKLEDLQQVELFRDLTAQQLAIVQGLCHRQDFAAGAVLMTEAQPGDVIYLIVQGSVKIAVQGGAEQEIILAMRGPGEVIGEMSLVDGLRRSANVVTQEPCVMLWLDRVAFWSQLWEMPPITYNLAYILSRRLRLASAQIQALSSLSVQERVARQILALAQDYGQDTGEGLVTIPLRLTQVEIGNMVGASRVRVNQILGYWKRRQYIRVDRRHYITVLNKEVLQRYCH